MQSLASIKIHKLKEKVKKFSAKLNAKVLFGIKPFAQDIEVLILAILTPINKTFRRILVSSRAAMLTAWTASLLDRYKIALALYFPGKYKIIHTEVRHDDPNG